MRRKSIEDSSYSENQKLIKEIARDLNLKEELVRTVMERYTDILIEKIVNNEKVTLRNIAVFTNFEQIYKVPNVNDSTAGVHKDLGLKKRIKVTVSPTLKKLYRLQNDEFSDKPYMIDRNSWRGALDWLRKRTPLNASHGENEPKNDSQLAPKNRVEPVMDNPFLEDENEEF